MKLSQRDKRKFNLVSLLFSLLLGILAGYLLLLDDISIGESILYSLIVSGCSLLSIHLSFAQLKEAEVPWINMAIVMVLYFWVLISLAFLFSLFFRKIETYPLIMGACIFVGVAFVACFILVIPFGLFCYWASHLSSSENNKPQK